MSEFVTPKNLSEALALRASHPEYEVMAGGTDLLVASKDRNAPAGCLNLFGLSELSGISWEQDKLRIGAVTTYAQILSNKDIAESFPLLCDAAREVGASQIHSR